ncbi:MAG: TonB-dependent receptor plug domain-containing protein, partial [Rhodanobacteraceae bacterium]
MSNSILSSRNLQLAIQVALFTAAGSISSLAFAQATTPPAQPTTSSPPAPNKTLQPVIVTGSRIRQVDLQTQQPILVMTRQEIQSTGLTTVNDILGHLDTIQTDPGANRQSTQGGTAGSYPDMRGLGASRVLVLVNGHRWMTDNNGRTDLATIPSSVIERIEVLKDGASAVYGSD